MRGAGKARHAVLECAVSLGIPVTIVLMPKEAESP